MATSATTHTHWFHRVLRAVIGGTLVVGGVLVMIQHSLLRQFETVLASFLSNGVTPGEMYVAPGGHSFFWLASTPEMHGLRVTAECTSAFMLGPMLMVAGLILASGRFSVVRALTATSIAAAVLVMANQGRLVLIAWATAKWGVAEGYQWSHTVGGSIVVGAGVALALVAFMLVLAARKRGSGNSGTGRRNRAVTPDSDSGTSPSLSDSPRGRRSAGRHNSSPGVARRSTYKPLNPGA